MCVSYPLTWKGFNWEFKELNLGLSSCKAIALPLILQSYLLNISEAIPELYPWAILKQHLPAQIRLCWVARGLGKGDGKWTGGGSGRFGAGEDRMRVDWIWEGWDWQSRTTPYPNPPGITLGFLDSHLLNSWWGTKKPHRDSSVFTQGIYILLPWGSLLPPPELWLHCASAV